MNSRLEQNARNSRVHVQALVVCMACEQHQAAGVRRLQAQLGFSMQRSHPESTSALTILSKFCVGVGVRNSWTCVQIVVCG